MDHNTIAIIGFIAVLVLLGLLVGSIIVSIIQSRRENRLVDENLEALKRVVERLDKWENTMRKEEETQ